MTTKKYPDHIYLEIAKEVFTDYALYEAPVIIGYCKLLQQIVDERNLKRLPKRAYSLSQLISVCYTLPKRQRELIKLRYIDALIYADIGDKWRLSAERIRQLDSKTIRYLQQKQISFWYSVEKLNILTTAEKKAKDGNIAAIYKLPIEVLSLSAKTHNALCRAHILTIEQLLSVEDKKLSHINNLGPRGFEEIKSNRKLNYYLNLINQG